MEALIRDTPPAPEWVRAEEWTPEQQKREAERRFLFVKLLYARELPIQTTFAPRPSDVIIATAPKSGTTWVTHICHQIRMGGSQPDFESQNDVVVFVMTGENADPDAKLQPADPRIFITRAPGPLVPRGGKVITCFREPKDIVLSACNFYDTLLAFKGRVSIEILSWCMIDMGRVKDVLESIVYWWEHRHDKDVLLLFFDDIKEDHIGCVRRIASFMAVDCSEEVIAKVVHTTTHAEMARHHSKFMSKVNAKRFANALGDIAPCEQSGRVRKDGGNSGEGERSLPGELKQQIEKEWKELVWAKLGFKDLNEMRLAWRKEQ